MKIIDKCKNVLGGYR